MEPEEEEARSEGEEGGEGGEVGNGEKWPSSDEAESAEGL